MDEFNLRYVKIKLAMTNLIYGKMLILGDIVGVEGVMFKTNTGDVSVKAKKFTLLTKSCDHYRIDSTVYRILNRDIVKDICRFNYERSSTRTFINRSKIVKCVII
ncbi:hypothetical protein MHBAU11_00010 [Staphylococcus aureus]